MALSPDELAQVRDGVRVEPPQGTSMSTGKIVGLVILGVFGPLFAILALHVLVIGAFTIWHWTHLSN
jgi:hypothetical protein